MKTISIMAQKGGAGKTTLSLHLAVLADQLGFRSALVDLDPQRSAAMWWEVREIETPMLIEAAAAQLDEIVASAKTSDVKMVFIDTPPHATYEAEIACRVADFVLIPCRPAVLDLQAIGKTLELVRETGAKAGLVLNHCPPSRTIIGEAAIVKEARQGLKAYDIPICPTAVTERVAFSHALIDGRAVTEYEPDGKASKEIHSVLTWLCEAML